MKIKLSKNIRKFRKEKGMTQEQLAEALGVTVGAISKWELGTSVPELAMIAAMAEFFELSMDTLVGYEMQNGKVDEMLARIKAYRKEKNFIEGALLAEKALVKYPNHFGVVHASAEFYNLYGVESGDKKWYFRSNELLKRAIDLLPQNTDPEINEITLRNDIAENYRTLGNYEKALEELKRNNIFGINHAIIGSILAADLKRPKEAYPYLKKALGHTMMTFTHVVSGYMNAYHEEARYRDAMEAMELLFSFYDIMRKDFNVVYMDKLYAILLVSCAVEALELGDSALAALYVRRAYEKAKTFDASPNYGEEGIHFCEGGEEGAVAYDDIGATAMLGIERMISACQREELTSIWKSVKESS